MMFSSVPRKGSITGRNIVVLSLTLFAASFGNARDWKSWDQQLHLKRTSGYSAEPLRTLNQADPQQTSKEPSKEHLNQMFSKIQNRKNSEFRLKRAVFDILPESAKNSSQGVRIQILERKDDPDDHSAKKKEQQERIKGLLKKYLKTFVSKRRQKRKKYSSVRMCRFTFMKICQRMVLLHM